MFRLVLVLLAATSASAADRLFELAARFEPAGPAVVTIYGATVPFQSQTESNLEGSFRFRKLRAGSYTIGVVTSDRGEARQTIEVGPGTADAQGRVNLTLRFRDADFVMKDVARRQHSVSTRQLALPARAMREYQAALKDLERHDPASAAQRLEGAIEIAPQFADAWNLRGTIAYQTQDYARAERCFRAAVEQDPQAYEPLVNLGGVLLNNQKLEEALRINQNAVLLRPGDALANSQLGLAYFLVPNFNLASKYLEIARRIDPAHFSHPQLVLAEIRLRQGENRAAADMLEEFLNYHPDFPTAAKIRTSITALRAE